MSKDALAISDEKPLALTPQQKRFSESQSKLALYRELNVADSGWAALIAFEFVNVLTNNLTGLLGVGLRSLLIPPFFKSFSSRPVINRGVTIRQPGRISLGRGVVLDDFSVLDIRSGECGATTPGIKLGDHVLLGRGSIVSTKGGTVTIGNGCNISNNCRLTTRAKLTVGDSTLIAAYCYIGPGNHQLGSDVTDSIMEQPMAQAVGVSIGSNVWIGTRVTILDGVSVGDNAVIGAHSLVLHDVPAGAIVAGTPAKVIKTR